MRDRPPLAMQLLALPKPRVLTHLTPDGRLLFTSRTIRLFAYGMLAVVLVLYLAALGFSEAQIGLLLTLTLAGDAVVALGIGGIADRVGRRRMLLASAGLMLLASVAFVATSNPLLLTVAAVVGTLSPSGGEVGPAAAIEQATLPQTVPDAQRTAVFAWYNLAGSLATALGALVGGVLATALERSGLTPLVSYRAVIAGYGLLGLALGVIYLRLSPAAEPPRRQGEQADAARSQWFGLHRSRRTVVSLSALFMLDAFAGGLVVQSLIAYWFNQRFGIAPATIGAIFFGANLFAGLSALAAAGVAARFGLLNTMVWTHIPSNVLLMLVPLMPTLPLAVFVLLARFSISQMDVPTRQSYTAAVVEPDERAAAASVTTTARTAGSALAPLLSGMLLGAGWLAAPFLVSGGLKIVYDLLLLRSFRAIKPPEERPESPGDEEGDNVEC